MKKFGKALALLAAGALLFGSVLSSCSSGSDDDDDDPKIKVTAADNATSVVVGKTLQLTADVDGVTWSSSDTAVATVDESGLVTGVAAAESVTITAEKDGYDKGTITLAVKAEGDDPDTPADGAMGFIWLAEDYVSDLDTDASDSITEEKTFGDVTVLATSTSTVTRVNKGSFDLSIDGETKSVKGYFQLGAGGTSAKKAMKFTVPSDATSVAIYAKKSSDSKTCNIVLNDGTTEVISQEASTDYTAVTYTPSLTADTVFYLYNDGDGGTNVKAIVVTTPPYTLQSIKVTTLPTKLEYAKNDTELSTDGMVVKATYSNGTKEVSKEVTGWTTSGFTAGAEGTQKITVSYTEGEGESAVTQTDTFEITVKGVTQTGIEVTTKPTTATYEQDSAIDLTGLEIAPVMSDGSKGTAVTSGITYVEGFDSTTAGENITKTIKVKYGEYTTTFEYTYTVTAVTYFTSLSFTDDAFNAALTKAGISVTKDGSTSIGVALEDAGGTWTIAAPASGNFQLKDGTGAFSGSSFTTYDSVKTYTRRFNPNGSKSITIKLKTGTGTVNLRVDAGPASNGNEVTYTFTGATTVEWKPSYSGTKFIEIAGDSDGYVTITTGTANNPNFYGIYSVESTDVTATGTTENTTLGPITKAAVYSAPTVTGLAASYTQGETINATATVPEVTASTSTVVYADGTLGETTKGTESVDASTITWTATPESGDALELGSGARLSFVTSATFPAGTYSVTASYTIGEGDDAKPYSSDAASVQILEAGVSYHTVTFYDSDGTTVLSTTQAKAGDKVEKPADPVKSGYNFAGWVTEKDGSTAFDFDTATADSTDNINIYASWTVAATTVHTLVIPDSLSAGTKGTFVTINDIFATDIGKTENTTVKSYSGVGSFTMPSKKLSLSSGQLKYASKKIQGGIQFATTGAATLTAYVEVQTEGSSVKPNLTDNAGKTVSGATLSIEGTAGTLGTTTLPGTATGTAYQVVITIPSAGTYYFGDSGAGKISIYALSVEF